MKKLNKIQLNPEKFLKDEELLVLKGGGYPSYMCYKEGWIPGCMGFLTGINTINCQTAQVLCRDLYGGYCVTGWDC